MLVFYILTLASRWLVTMEDISNYKMSTSKWVFLLFSQLMCNDTTVMAPLNKIKYISNVLRDKHAKDRSREGAINIWNALLAMIRNILDSYDWRPLEVIYTFQQGMNNSFNSSLWCGWTPIFCN